MWSNNLFLNLLFFVFLLVKAVHLAGQSARRLAWSPRVVLHLGTDTQPKAGQWARRFVRYPPLILQVGKSMQQQGKQLRSQLLKQENTNLHKHGSSHLQVAKSASSCRVRAAYGSHKVSAMLKVGSSVGKEVEYKTYILIN